MAFVSENRENSYYVSLWRHNNPLPEQLKNLTIEEFELILRLASESLIHLRESTQTHKFEDILNKKISNLNGTHQQELNLLKSQYNDDISKKQKLLEKEQVSRREIQESYNLLHQNFLNLQNSVSQTIEKNLSCSLEKQNIFFSGQVESIKKAFESRESMYKDQIIELKTHLEKYQKQLLIEQNSSVKGKQGESSFDTLVKQHTSWVLEDTSKIPDACDRQSNIKGCKTLFEIKNYSNKVPKTEVDKFKRNMETHKDAQFGVFISLKTNIIGGAQDCIYSEITSNNQILLYIQNFDTLDKDTIFSVINNYIDMALLLHAKIQCDVESEDLQLKIDSIKPILNDSFKEISLMVNKMNSQKKTMVNIINEQTSTLQLHINKIKLLFESILKVFFQEESTVTAMEIDDDTKKKVTKRKKSSDSLTNSIS